MSDPKVPSGWKVHPNDPMFKSAPGRLRIFKAAVEDIYLDKKVSVVKVARSAEVKPWVANLYLCHLVRLVWWARERFSERDVDRVLVREKLRLEGLARAMELGYYHLPNHPISWRGPFRPDHCQGAAR